MARQPTSGDRPTVKDVAAASGVSATTVSRVLAGNYPVSAATRARVLKAVRELDYVINAQARALVGGGTKTVAFIVHDLVGPSFAYVGQGVEQQATAEGRLCLVCATHGDPERELELVELMREQQAEAVVLVGGRVNSRSYVERAMQIAHALDKSGSRLVLCGSPPLGPDVPATVVEYDNEGGAYAVTSYLISLGHRDIAFLGAGEPGHTTIDGRLRGFERAHEAHQLPMTPHRTRAITFDRESGYQATRDLLSGDRTFTAIFAATDVVASGVLVALREAGLRVPEDVSVVGYDDIPLARDLTPELTTVHVDYEELGRTAVRYALNRDRHAMSQHTVIGTHVIIRDSAGPPPRRSGRADLR
ncbi:LacI family DNA-binding transcriptional regulator [Kribbella sp.]|uniref:LacI family DNA-binding transcriptional regulator n=1 Tax=Kribbella sp. TaxID=1871183 RepID=UPI002D2662FB|nr:LacI family DNA-binding transcriptional regulator [Kribbella sp.]HZX02107.1 LacI family DNA-binding transcriptional regulator [Kribbella sp.]